MSTFKVERQEVKPVVYQLKIQNLTKVKQLRLEWAFLEAKWLYNHLVCSNEPLNPLQANKIKEVPVKVGDAFEIRKLEVLGSQIKQGIAKRVRNNFKALNQLRKRGYEVGDLKPKPFLNSFPLPQYGNTYSFDFKGNKVHIQRLGKFRVLGLHQIPPIAEIASATLIRKPNGFYLNVTCYLPQAQSLTYRSDRKGRQWVVAPTLIDKPIAIDFGVRNKVTLSNGLAIDFEVGETKRLKRLQRMLARCQKGSKRRERVRWQLRKEWQRICQRRRDAQNKVLAFLKCYRWVIFQDDYIKGWHENGFGGSVQRSGIGGLKSRLKHSLEAPIVIERFERTTAECFFCGHSQPLPLSELRFKCSHCGYSIHRDLNATWVMLRKGLGLSPNQPLPLGGGKLRLWRGKPLLGYWVPIPLSG